MAVGRRVPAILCAWQHPSNTPSYLTLPCCLCAVQAHTAEANVKAEWQEHDAGGFGADQAAGYKPQQQSDAAGCKVTVAARNAAGAVTCQGATPSSSSRKLQPGMLHSFAGSGAHAAAGCDAQQQSEAAGWQPAQRLSQASESGMVTGQAAAVEAHPAGPESIVSCQPVSQFLADRTRLQEEAARRLKKWPTPTHSTADAAGRLAKCPKQQQQQDALSAACSAVDAAMPAAAVAPQAAAAAAEPVQGRAQGQGRRRGGRGRGRGRGHVSGSHAPLAPAHNQGVAARGPTDAAAALADEQQQPNMLARLLAAAAEREAVDAC